MACSHQTGCMSCLRRWWLGQRRDEDNFAHGVLRSGEFHPSLGKWPAKVWFENLDADRYEMSECCMQGPRCGNCGPALREMLGPTVGASAAGPFRTEFLRSLNRRGLRARRSGASGVHRNRFPFKARPTRHAHSGKALPISCKASSPSWAH